MGDLAPVQTFSRRQVVLVGSPMGSRLDRGVIIGGHAPKIMGGLTGWYVVQFDDGSGMSVHASNMRPSNERPFRGPLPTYRQTQGGCNG